MAVAYVAERAVQNSPVSSVYYEVVPITSNCTLNNRLILTHGTYTYDITNISVYDSKGNTWTIDAGPNNANGYMTLIASTGQNAAALTTSDTVVIAYNSAPTGGRSTWIEEFQNVGVSDGNSQNSSVTMVSAQNAGTTTPVRAGDLTVAVFATPPGGTYSINASGTVGTYSRFTTGDQPTALPSPMQATFIQPSINTQYPTINWTSAQFETDFAYLVSVGITDVIVQWTVDQDANEAYYPSYSGWVPQFSNMVPNILTAAAAAGIRVWLGLCNTYNWQAHASDPTWLYNQYYANTITADQLYALYGSQFYGWYISNEVSDSLMSTSANVTPMTTFFQNNTTYLHSHDGNKPVMTSPTYQNLTQTPSQFAASCAAVMGTVDVLNVQDSGGSGYIASKDIKNWFTALNTQFAGTSTQVWQNADMFAPSPSIGPMNSAVLQSNLSATAGLVSKRCGFSFITQMDPTVLGENYTFSAYRSYATSAVNVLVSSMYQLNATTSTQKCAVTLSSPEPYQAVMASYYLSYIQVRSSDFFSGTDSVSKQQTLSSETGSAVENVLGRHFSDRDSVVGSEVATLHVSLSATETASAAEAVKSVGQTVFDASNAAVESSAAKVLATDTVTAQENNSAFTGSTTPVQVQLGSFTESAAVSAAFVVSDFSNRAVDGGEAITVLNVNLSNTSTMAPGIPAWIPQDLGGLSFGGNPLNPDSVIAPEIPSSIPANLGGLGQVGEFVLGLVGQIPNGIPCDLGGLQQLLEVPQGSVGWEVVVKSGTELGNFQTLLAVIPRFETLSFSVELNDKGTGSITLDLDDPLFSTLLADGSDPETLLTEDHLWQIYQDGNLVFEFLGETTVETLVDPSEARPVTISGAGTIQVLTWARTVPPGFGTDGYIPKLWALMDTLVAPDAPNLPEQDLWNECVGAGTNVYLTTPPGGIEYIQEVGFQASGASVALFETIPVHIDMTAGDTMILIHGTGLDAADIPGIGISDSVGNTWSIDAINSDANKDLVLIASTRMDVGTLTESDTITIQYPIAPTGGRATWLEEFQGLGLADKSTSAFSNYAASSMVAGNLFPAVENELVVVAFTAPGSAVNYNFNAAGTVGYYSEFASPTSIVGLGSTNYPKLVGTVFQTGSSASAQQCVASPVHPAPYQSVMAAYKPNPGVLAAGGPVIITGINDITKPFPTMGAGVYDATYSSFYAAVTCAPIGNGTTCTMMTLYVDANNYVQFQIGQAEWATATEYTQNADSTWGFSCVMCSNGVVTSYGPPQGGAAYDFINMNYLRFRESGGTVFWDTSPDGSSWTQYYQQAHTFPMNKVHVRFQVASTSAETAPRSASVSGINLNAGSYDDIHTFTNTPQMAMFYQLVQEAQQNRNVIPFLNQTYTPYEDSVGNSWTDSLTLAQGNGVDYYSLLQQFTAAIGAEYIMLPGFNLVVCNADAYGSDLSDSIIFYEGGQQTSKQRTRIRDSISNVFYIEDSVGRFVTSNNSSSQTSFMNREGYLSAQGAMVPSTMKVIANAGIEQVSTPIISWVLTVPPDTVGRRIFDDYNVGDWIGVEDYSTGAIIPLRVMVAAIAIDNTQTVTCELTLETRIQAFDELLQALVNKLNGNQTTGTSFASITNALEGAAGAQSGVILPGGGVMSSLPSVKPATKFSYGIASGITNVTHNLGTYDVTVQVWTAAANPILVAPVASGGAINYTVTSLTVNEIQINLASGIGNCRVVIAGGGN